MGLPNHLRTIYSSLTTKFEFLQVQHVGQVLLIIFKMMKKFYWKEKNKQ